MPLAAVLWSVPVLTAGTDLGLDGYNQSGGRGVQRDIRVQAGQVDLHVDSSRRVQWRLLLRATSDDENDTVRAEA